MDTEATNHISFNLSWLKNLRPVNGKIPHIIRLADGSSYVVCNIGVYKISPDLTLKNVLNVPFFRYNLISISKLTTDSSCKVCLFFFLTYMSIAGSLKWQSDGNW